MMNIMYAFDNNYAEIAAVSIKSLMESNPAVVNFYLVLDNVSEQNKVMMEEMISEHGSTVTFLANPPIRELLGVDLKTLRWSDSAYSRLFLKELFGEGTSIDRLIYIDCDTLIVGSLIELYETDTEGYLGAACLECMSNMHKRIVGASKKDNYINTGMLLIDVQKWIKEGIQEKTSEFIRKYNGKTEYVDQGVINGTISNEFKLVSPKYNLTALAYDFTYKEMQIYRKPSFGYSEDEWEEAKNDPRIIHFTTSFLSIRPWYEGSMHPYAGSWKEVHDRTPWKNCTHREMKNRASRDRRERAYHMFPRSISVRMAGFLHAYVKPIVYALRG